MKFSKQKEQQVIASLKKGDKHAFALIYSEYYAKLIRYIFAISDSDSQAEDVVQDTFLYIWKNHKKLKNEGAFSAYLYKCSHNFFIDKYRKESRRFKLIEQLRQEAFLELEYAEKEVKEKRLTALLKIIDQLPEKRKDIFILYKLNNYRYKEIADMRNISVRTVESQIRKALITIKQQVAQLQADNLISILLLFLCS